jgi:hypothetical protein
MIYFITDGEYVKIGYSTTREGVDARLAGLQTGNPRPLYLLHAMEGTSEDEKFLHNFFSLYRMTGEWFWFAVQAPETELSTDVTPNEVKIKLRRSILPELGLLYGFTGFIILMALVFERLINSFGG